MKVFVTRAIPAVGLKLMQEAGLTIVQWTEKRDLTKDELIYHSKQFDGLLSAGPNKIDKDVLNACKHLKVIALLSAQSNCIDVAEATKLKIPVSNTPPLSVISSSSVIESRNIMSEVAARNIIAGLNDESLPNPVNPEVSSVFLKDYFY